MKKFLAFLFIASLLSFANAKDAIPSVPNPPRLVNDYAGVFTHGQKAELEERLVAFNDSTSNVVCVVVVSDLGDYSAADFAFEIGNRWGIQNKKDQNGLVVLIKVRNETAGDVFIATGYAFEGVLPDAYVKEIITEEMVPLLKEEKYYEATVAAINKILPILSGEISVPRDQYQTSDAPEIAFVLTIIFVTTILLIIATVALNRKNRREALITQAVKNQRYQGEDKEQLFLQVKKLGLNRDRFEEKLKDEILKQLIAPALEDKIVTREERRYIFQQAVAMGYSHTSIEKKLQQMIDEEAQKMIDEELELHNGHIDEQQMLQKLILLGISALVFNNLLKQRKTLYRTRHSSSQHFGGSSFGGGFGGGSHGSFGGGFGGFGSGGGFGGGGAGSRF